VRAVGIFEAKTHFSALVDDAERGRSTLVTRKGRPVARIMAVVDPKPREFGFDDGLGSIADDFDAQLPRDVLEPYRS
jgi:prevent-host-death family protein